MNRRGFLIIVALLVGAMNNTPRVAADAERSSLNGRWDVTFDIPQQQYRTIIEFDVANDNRVRAESLGYPLIKFTEGRLAENKLTLKGASPYGAVEINATLEGNRLIGKWQVALLSGEVRGTRASANGQSVSRLAVFDSVWNTLDKQFYDPRFNGVDWQSARARYRPQAESARTDGELLAVIRNMLAELRSSHLDFSALSLEQSFTDTKPKAADAAAAAPINWRVLAPDVGYIQIKQFDESPEIIRLVDRAFAEVGSLPSLVIDVRGNPGGTLSAAMRIGDYLYAKPQPVGYFVTRAGLARRTAQSIEQIKPATLPTYNGYSTLGFRRELAREGALMIVTGGRAPQFFRGRVVLLVDKGCGSTTEGFAAVLKETRAATLIGRRTAGAMLSSIELPVIGGWTLRLPEADFRTPGGARVEGAGVEPDIKVQKGLFGDADLERALSFLQTSQAQTQQ